MDTQRSYKQTWNSRSKKWVLIDCSPGIKGGMTGQMSETKFEGVPVVNGKPAPEETETETEKIQVENGKEAANVGNEDSSADSGWLW